MQGANIDALKAKIQQHIGNDSEDSGEDLGQGLVCVIFFSINSIITYRNYLMKTN